MNFIAYILSIENSERREHVENLANKLLEKGFKKVEIIDAIYWKEHDVLNILRNLNIKLINSNISRSQIACFLTHRKAWETIITKESNDIHIILEDDMDINSEFSIEKLEDVYGSIERKDYDSIFLYKHPEQISVTNESYNNYLLKHYFQWGLCAYSISPEFAKELYEFIKNIFSQTIHQYKIDWSKNIDTNRYLPFDFCIEEYKIIIELDGKQHFEQVMNWKTPEEQYKNDKYKEKCANENGYSIIRLLQEDVFNDKYDWKTELINNIEKIKTDNIIQNIYMCKNNEYQHFN